MKSLHVLLRLFLRTGAASAVLAAVAVGTACFAEDFQARTIAKVDADDPQCNWQSPKMWQTAANTDGVPATANDVGIIARGHRIAVWAPLGTPSSRPTIKVEQGGDLNILNDLVNPLIVAGGTLDGAWFTKTVAGPIQITADSTFRTHDEWVGWQFHIGGPVSNAAPVSLHLSGAIEWLSDSHKTFSGNLDIDRGKLGINGPQAGPQGSGVLGTGEIRLAPGTEFRFEELPYVTRYLLVNNLWGFGCVWAGNGAPTQILVSKGIAMHPGLPDRPGTLAIQGSLDFQRNGGQPGKLIIEVQGDGSGPTDDYGQLAVLGNVTNSLDNEDLILQLKPDMSADQAAALHLIVLTTRSTDLMGPNAKPFHSVRVIAGNRKGSASATIKLDPMTGQDVVEVTGITFK